MESLTNKRQQLSYRQTLTNKRRRPPPPPGARWLILNSRIDDKGGNSSIIADDKTTAACCTSSGKPFSISFGIASPPASCSLHFDWLGDGKPEHNGVRVIAGHDDAVLIQIQMTVPKTCRDLTPTYTHEHFLYEARGGNRVPSLLLLPAFYIPVQSGDRKYRPPSQRFRHLSMENTGILRRGEDGEDLVVCQFEMTWNPPFHYYTSAELCMLRIGGGDWIVRRQVPILEHRDGSSELQPRRPKLVSVQAAVPVGNRFLCWVDYSLGFILCDMVDEENPKLRYVRLPIPATQGDAYCLHSKDLNCSRTTLGAIGPDTVRFVLVDPPPRGADGMLLKRSSPSFSVMTWTLTLSTEEATTWVKDAVLDCEEIWKCHLSYGSLLRDKRLEYPMVRCDEPEVIWFWVEGMAVEINTRSKKLLSVMPSGSRDQHKPHQRSTQGGRVTSILAKLHW